MSTPSTPSTPSTTNELRDIFLHHIILFLDVTKFFDLLKFEPENSKTKWYKENWYKNSVNKIEVTTSATYWLVNGKFHRDDGAACEYSDGYREWWINGKFISEDIVYL